MIATADDHRQEVKVLEFNEAFARTIGDTDAAERLRQKAEYHRKRQQELSS